MSTATVAGAGTPSPDETIRRTVKALRSAHGVDARILAAHLGISRNSLYNRLNGAAQFLPRHPLELLTEAIDVPPHVAAGGDQVGFELARLDPALHGADVDAEEFGDLSGGHERRHGR